ncbi:MAG TPA: amidohydrolase [Thermomicrobiales bacterium]|jgi:amidohydrolase|nr:amidohydrolase [Thermomicrobiales bacterium]
MSVADSATIHAAVDEIQPGLVADRRHLHEHPELGMQETETAKFVAARLQQLGLEEIRTGIANTGITALIRGTNPDGPGAGKVVLLRADMDALPILEENQVDYVSQNPGVMHACGHDAHTTMLMGTARILMGMRDQFAGTVKVLFQPAEEGPGGAEPMIAEGVMENPTVNAAFGIHVAADLPAGQVKVASGPRSAAADSLRLTIQGKGAHGAAPHLGIDPIVIGAEIINALQTIVSRNVDPLERAVITVGALHAGVAPNVIPDTAEMRATIRSFNPEVRDLLAKRIPEVCEGIAAAMGASVTIDYKFGYPPLINNGEMAALVKRAAADVLGPDNVHEATPGMGAEDMAYFLNMVPGCFYNVGVRNEERGITWGAHHPKFDIDEDSLGVGVKVMTSVVMRYFAEG